LCFNDNGTLGMDCAQGNDDVTASSQSSSGLQLQARTEVVRRAGLGIVQTLTTMN